MRCTASTVVAILLYVTSVTAGVTYDPKKPNRKLDIFNDPTKPTTFTPAMQNEMMNDQPFNNPTINMMEMTADANIETEADADAKPIVRGYIKADTSLGKSSLSKRGLDHGYTCVKSKKYHASKFIKEKKITKSLTAACKRMGATIIVKWPYPCVFTSRQYVSPSGPYYEWPIGYKGIFSLKKVSRYRLIINHECKLVDVVTYRHDGWYQQCASGWK